MLTRSPEADAGQREPKSATKLTSWPVLSGVTFDETGCNGSAPNPDLANARPSYGHRSITPIVLPTRAVFANRERATPPIGRPNE